MTTIKCDSLGCRFNSDGFCRKDHVQLLTKRLESEKVVAYCRDKDYKEDK